MAIRKGPYVFYNQLTGDRFRDLKDGLTKGGKKRRARRGHVAYIQAHFRFAADARRDRPGYGERAPWARGHLDNDALRPYQR